MLPRVGCVIYARFLCLAQVRNRSPHAREPVLIKCVELIACDDVRRVGRDGGGGGGGEAEEGGGDGGSGSGARPSSSGSSAGAASDSNTISADCTGAAVVSGNAAAAWGAALRDGLTPLLLLAMRPGQHSSCVARLLRRVLTELDAVSGRETTRHPWLLP